MRRVAFIVILIICGALLAGCSESNTAEQIKALRAAEQSCPSGIKELKYHNDGTDSIEKVVCK